MLAFIFVWLWPIVHRFADENDSNFVFTVLDVVSVSGQVRVSLLLLLLLQPLLLLLLLLCIPWWTLPGSFAMPSLPPPCSISARYVFAYSTTSAAL